MDETMDRELVDELMDKEFIYFHYERRNNGWKCVSGLTC